MVKRPRKKAKLISMLLAIDKLHLPAILPSSSKGLLVATRKKGSRRYPTSDRLLVKTFQLGLHYRLQFNSPSMPVDPLRRPNLLMVM